MAAKIVRINRGAFISVLDSLLQLFAWLTFRADIARLNRWKVKSDHREEKNNLHY